MTDSTHDSLAGARTLLFVPGDRSDRFARAADCGADAIVLDLEDAVSPAAKAAARSHAAAWLALHPGTVVRINGHGTPWFADDVAMASRYDCAVMVPKAEDPALLAELRRSLPGRAVIPLIETATGVLRARDLCGAPGVVRPALGTVDLAAQLGVRHDDRAALDAARLALVLAAASAAVGAPIDGVTTALSDKAALVGDVKHARRLGLTGKLCVHPRQVAPVHTALAPEEEDLAWARRVVSAAGDGSATSADGQLIDKPVVDRARRILSGLGSRG